MTASEWNSTPLPYGEDGQWIKTVESWMGRPEGERGPFEWRDGAWRQWGHSSWPPGWQGKGRDGTLHRWRYLSAAEVQAEEAAATPAEPVKDPRAIPLGKWCTLPLPQGRAGEKLAIEWSASPGFSSGAQCYTWGQSTRTGTNELVWHWSGGFMRAGEDSTLFKHWKWICRKSTCGTAVGDPPTVPQPPAPADDWQSGPLPEGGPGARILREQDSGTLFWDGRGWMNGPEFRGAGGSAVRREDYRSEFEPSERWRWLQRPGELEELRGRIALAETLFDDTIPKPCGYAESEEDLEAQARRILYSAHPNAGSPMGDLAEALRRVEATKELRAEVARLELRVTDALEKSNASQDGWRALGHLYSAALGNGTSINPAETAEALAALAEDVPLSATIAARLFLCTALECIVGEVQQALAGNDGAKFETDEGRAVAVVADVVRDCATAGKFADAAASIRNAQTVRGAVQDVCTENGWTL